MLRIDTEIPSDFQEHILPEYANLTERQEVKVDIQLGNKLAVTAKEMKQIKNYEFASEDNSWKVN